ncbi:hypothetical protein HCN44_005603 [Aphidius gifuensis]|uniref:Cyclin-like domain-containing protein n=1 Tax=Aphidius gifuensis TaxID=684658 RepID=A0A834Y3G7_APHGI|nr:hypothetical protein HCN44_005603 [Aphidius gifuensis]
MPCWYYDKKELRRTPSIQDGIDYDTECRYRKEGARFIIDTGSKMDLGYNTMATGVVYFHRFYMFHSFQQFPRHVTACVCLFLAGKVEETPKKCKDIIKIAKSQLTEQKFLTFERILLQTIKFDLQVEHPYSYLLEYAKCLKGDKNKLQKMVQMAWTFANDSLCTTLCLQWEPEIIAVALLYLAGKLSKFEVVDWNGRQPKHLRWWDMFVEDLTMDLLEDISNQAKPPDSPPLIPPSQQASRENQPPVAIDQSSNLSNVVTPSKITKIDSTIVSSNGYQQTDPLEPSKSQDKLSHFPNYQQGFKNTPGGYQTGFSQTNISVPPPSVNTVNHMVTTMRMGSHIRQPSTIPSTVVQPVVAPPPPPPPPLPAPFVPYGYPTNASYFQAGNQIAQPPPPPPPGNSTRSYYAKKP